MSVLFFDSSALVKRYLTEAGSAWVASLLDPSLGHMIVVATITQVECAAALASRHRAGAITQSERDDLVDLLALHFDTYYQQVAIEEPILSRAVGLTQNLRLGGYDAVQLASALVVHDQYVAAGFPGLTLISADDDVNTAAQVEGLTAENPNSHP
jgi:predicted nucleic acid-binding protein